METKEKEPKIKSPNEKLKLDGFDYENLKGESFEKYQVVVDGLQKFDSYDFELYKASGVFEMTFDKNLNKVSKLVGINLEQSKPLNTTRITAGEARDLNGQIYNPENPRTNSKYYLLKK
jgi:hypothetical protein